MPVVEAVEEETGEVVEETGPQGEQDKEMAPGQREGTLDAHVSKEVQRK